VHRLLPVVDRCFMCYLQVRLIASVVSIPVYFVQLVSFVLNEDIVVYGLLLFLTLYRLYPMKCRRIGLVFRRSYIKYAIICARRLALVSTAPDDVARIVRLFASTRISAPHSDITRIYARVNI
jgi:hypothetical protein